MPANALTVLEQQLQPLSPRFADVLGKTMPVERLMRTIVLSVERLPQLLDCDRQSLFNAAMSAACLGLEVDGVTGQAYLIPFKGKAQLVIGYKGMTTMAARSGITIAGACVREGDEFDYELGDKPYLRHKPVLGNRGRIIAAWATATAVGRPPIISVLGIDDINAIKARSPGAKRSDSPWNDPAIGFPAMAEKSAKRRLSRSLPLNVMQLGARMEEAVEEQGQSAWIDPHRGVIVDGECSPLPERQAEQPTTIELITPPSRTPPAGPPADTGAFSSNPSHDAAGSAPAGDQRGEPAGAGDIPSAEEYERRWDAIIESEASSTQIGQTWASQKEQRKRIDWSDGALDRIMAKVTRAINEKRAQENRP